MGLHIKTVMYQNRLLRLNSRLQIEPFVNWFVRMCKSLGFRSCCWIQHHGRCQNMHTEHEQIEHTYLKAGSLMKVHHLSVLHIYFFNVLWSEDDGVVHIAPDRSNQHCVNTGRKLEDQDVAGAVTAATGCFLSLPRLEMLAWPSLPPH